MTRGAAREVSGLPIYRPDIGDVASMLLISRGADRVLGEVGGAAWLTACGRDIGGILSRAVRIARGLERLTDTKIPSEEELHRLIDWDTADINWRGFESGELLPRPSQEQIASAKRIDSTDSLDADLLDCDGMSAVRVLAAATQHYCPRGLAAYRGVTAKELISLLRIAFDPEEIEKEGVYWRLKEWQWQNKRYDLFRQWRKLESFNVLLDQRYIKTDIEHLAKSGLPFAAIQLDLDNFKNVNDVLGHPEGDEAIRIVEKILLVWVGGRGESYRRGGDELAAVIVGVGGTEAREYAECLRQEIESKFQEWAQVRSLRPAPTASIGVVHVAHLCSPEDLLEQLEAAQMQAKQDGKNRVVSIELAKHGSVA
jgi:diguanylate cyclase (GGDEF)-like protein